MDIQTTISSFTHLADNAVATVFGTVFTLAPTISAAFYAYVIVSAGVTAVVHLAATRDQRQRLATSTSIATLPLCALLLPQFKTGLGYFLSRMFLLASFFFLGICTVPADTAAQRLSVVKAVGSLFSASWALTSFLEHTGMLDDTPSDKKQK